MKTPEILYESCQGHPWLDSPCLQTFDWVNFINDYLIVRQPIVFSSVLCIWLFLFLKAHFQAWEYFWQLKAWKKSWKMLFISPRKVFSFSRYLNFCLDSYYRNGLIKKVNSKCYDVTAWLTHILLMHILLNISRGRDNENEIWSVNRM